MIGIYKITNKLNQKSYIGQSIHCGKRFDEHQKGPQLIDKVIQIDGIENFTFEILKETDKEHLSYWEDYYIMKYNTMIPNGYNQKWNCIESTRNELKHLISSNETKDDIVLDNSYILFPSSVVVLQKMNTNDCVYSWLLLHSQFNEEYHYNYIYKDDFTFTQIGNDINCSRITVSKKFKDLLNKNIIKQSNYNNKIIYIFAPDGEQEKVNKEVLLKLLSLLRKGCAQELIKTYIWIKKQYNSGQTTFSCCDLINAFGHSRGHKEIFDKYRKNFQLLQEAGLINYTSNLNSLRSHDGTFQKSISIEIKN